MSLTSLLNSLHSHLQQQTQLLPALHSQLGLPHTSLADELSALEEELTACVERQIDLRRKQVDEWMENCVVVENDCSRYSKALGGHIKVAGSGIGELRKEHILPKRYDALTEHQERLRQVSTVACLCQITTELTVANHHLVVPLETGTATNPHNPNQCHLADSWKRFLLAGYHRGGPCTGIEFGGFESVPGCDR